MRCRIVRHFCQMCLNFGKLENLPFYSKQCETFKQCTSLTFTCLSQNTLPSCDSKTSFLSINMHSWNKFDKTPFFGLTFYVLFHRCFDLWEQSFRSLEDLTWIDFFFNAQSLRRKATFFNHTQSCLTWKKHFCVLARKTLKIKFLKDIGVSNFQ